jgi:arginase family enzyme
VTECGGTRVNGPGPFRLNPYLRLVTYADRHFVYDARMSGSPLIEIPTRAIPENEYSALELIRAGGYLIDARGRNDILAYFAQEGIAPALLDAFIQQNFLRQYRSPGQVVQQKVLTHFNSLYAEPDAGSASHPPAPLDESEANLRVFGTNTFFNLPPDVEPAGCQVGLLGFPHASLNMSLGTELGPDLLRLYTRSISWFEVYKHGFYTEMTMDDGKPETLCTGVVVRDAGNLACWGATVTDLFASVETVLARDFFAHQVYPIIVGGDHAITYPIVMTYLKSIPDLGVLHLDAHSDLFFASEVVYNHGTFLSNLLQRTSIAQVASFGLRNAADSRVGTMNAIYDRTNAAERARLYSLNAVKQMIMSPERLESTLRALSGRPYYLTIDLDVLSETAIGGRVSTPLGVGLEWHELFWFPAAAFRHLDIIGCDVVEYNALNGGGADPRQLNALLLLLIDRLAGNNRRRRALPAGSGRGESGVA